MNKRFYTENEIREFKKRKIFSPKIISDSGLSQILDRIQKDGFKVWSVGEMDFKENFGLGYNICGRCGRLYLVTPVNDAYRATNSPYKICDSCLVDRTNIKI